MAFCKHRVMDKCKKDNMPCIFSKECCEPEEKKMTNADRIRHMTDEELAEFLANMQKFAIKRKADSKEEILRMLQAEVKEGNSDAS